MKEQSPKQQDSDLRRQRSNAVRTAWALAVVVLIIFTAFVLSGVLGQAPAQ